MKLSLALVAAVILTLGCGRTNTEANTERLGDHSYVVIGSGAALQRLPNALGGAGTVRFVAVPSSENVRVAFEARLAAGGSVTLVTNSTPTLDRGIRVVIRRDGATLKVLGLANGVAGGRELTLGVRDAAAALRVDIDIHNHSDGDGHARVQVNEAVETVPFAAVTTVGNFGYVLDRVTSISQPQLRASVGHP